MPDFEGVEDRCSISKFPDLTYVSRILMPEDELLLLLKATHSVVDFTGCHCTATWCRTFQDPDPFYLPRYEHFSVLLEVLEVAVGRVVRVFLEIRSKNSDIRN